MKDMKILKEKIQRLVFNDLVSVNDKEEKVLTFIPLLHLDYQKKIELLQQKTFGEIEIKMYNYSNYNTN